MKPVHIKRGDVLRNGLLTFRVEEFHVDEDGTTIITKATPLYISFPDGRSEDAAGDATPVP